MAWNSRYCTFQSDQNEADIGRQTDFLVNMAASADVLAQAKVEIDLSTIPEGKNVRYIFFIKQLLWRIVDIQSPGHHQMARKASLHPTPHPR